MHIDTNNENEIFEYEQALEKLKEKKENQDKYTADDIVLVRATNYIEPGHIIHPISQIPFIIKLNGKLRNVITRKLGDGRLLYQLNDDELKNLRIEAGKHLPYSTQYRSTVHFTLNGLVQSHTRGNFDNRNFVILEPFTYHLGKSNIYSLLPEDTFIEGQVKLSNQATILVEQSKIQELLKSFPALKEYNIVTYVGDQRLAVNMLLVKKGIVPERIRDKYIEDCPTARKLYAFIQEVGNNLNIKLEPHVSTDIYYLDDKQSLRLWEYYDYKFYTFLLDKIGMPKNEQDLIMKDLLDDNSETEIEKIISSIGLIKFKEIVDEYNQIILDKINNGTYPTNEELLKELETSHNYKK